MSHGETEPREPSPDRIRNRTEFSVELTLLRERAGLTVRDVSSQIGELQAHSTLGDWFAGRSVPSTSSQGLLIRVLRACGVSAEVEIERWVGAWRLVQRAPGRRTGPVPYRGLASFQPTDTDWFFGREVLTERVTAYLTDLYAAGGGLLMVVGASGSGKSSLLRAGVIPALTTRTAPGRLAWPLVPDPAVGSRRSPTAAGNCAGQRLRRSAVLGRIQSRRTSPGHRQRGRHRPTLGCAEPANTRSARRSADGT